MNKEKIYDALVMLSVTLGQKQETKRLEIYAENLANLDLGKVIRQIESFSRSARYFPQLVEIIEPLQGLSIPSDEMATVIANEILECAAKFSKDDIASAKYFLGDKFEIAQRFGWTTLVQLQYSDIPSSRAQLRELAKAYINRAKRDLKDGITSELKISTESRTIGNDKKESGLRLLKF